jgi:hypothetical protein
MPGRRGFDGFAITTSPSSSSTASPALCTPIGLIGPAHTPTSGTAPDRTKLTQVGRALAQLGIEHIVSFSPQARGRSERVNRTLQDRFVNELRVAGIRTLAAANRYLTERFPPTYNATFGRPPGGSHLDLCAPGPIPPRARLTITPPHREPNGLKSGEIRIADRVCTVSIRTEEWSYQRGISSRQSGEAE